jgi:hypothetical protein
VPRWAWFLPLALLVVLAALAAFRLGWLAANLTETDAIAVYAARYTALAGPGADLSDCVAVPAQGAWRWITVTCTRADGARWRFEVGRLGGLVRMTGPGDHAPQGAPRT